MVKHSSRIELNQVAYKGNINFIRKKIGDKPILSSVVKANAYGHGIEAFVPMAERCGINHFCVASSFEAEQVMSVCKAESQVLIMGIIYEEDLGWAISNGISFSFIILIDLLKFWRKPERWVSVL